MRDLKLKAKDLLVCLILMVGGCASMPYSAARMQRTELYFGLTRPNGPDVMEIEFQTFVDDVVASRFPQGFTVLNAQGHWREGQGTVRIEPSHLLIIIHPDSAEDQRKIEEIRTLYKNRFAQEAVLRIDHAETVSF